MAVIAFVVFALATARAAELLNSDFQILGAEPAVGLCASATPKKIREQAAQRAHGASRKTVGRTKRHWKRYLTIMPLWTQFGRVDPWLNEAGCHSPADEHFRRRTQSSAALSCNGQTN